MVSGNVGEWSWGRISWDQNSFVHEVKIQFVHEIEIHNNIFTILIRRSSLQSWDQNPNKHYYKFWSHDHSCD